MGSFPDSLLCLVPSIKQLPRALRADVWIGTEPDVAQPPVARAALTSGVQGARLGESRIG